MYNVAINLKPVRLFCVAMSAALLSTSCSSGGQDHQAALQLINQADSAICIREFEEALAILDTLKAAYPKEIDLQRTALNMRPRAIEGLTVSQIEENDRLQAYYGHVADSMMTYFTKVHEPELGSDYDYYVVKENKGRDLFGRTGLEGRVNTSGEFYVISSLTARPVKHTRVSLQGPDGVVTTTDVAYDGERNYRSGGTEMITFTAEECDTLGQYLLTVNPASKVKLTFHGQTDYTMALDNKDRLSLVRGYQLGKAVSEQRKLVLQRELLERQLALARDQMARTSAD